MKKTVEKENRSEFSFYHEKTSNAKLISKSNKAIAQAAKIGRKIKENFFFLSVFFFLSFLIYVLCVSVRFVEITYRKQ